jgi:hypothetical protein
MLQQQHKRQMAYLRSMGYYPGPRPWASLGEAPAEVPCIIVVVF